MTMTDLVLIQRLLLVTVLAGCVGFERERHGRAAGLRTHILVGLGACLVMLTSVHMVEAFAGAQTLDPTRMGAQVVSGIGFLGAGTILRFRASIRGLTTAASLWVVAGVGLAVGAGFLAGAILTTAVVVTVLMALGQWERRIRRDWYRVLVVEMQASGEHLRRLRETLARYEVEIRDFGIKRTDAPDRSLVELDLKLLSEGDEQGIVDAVSQVEGVQRVRWA